MDRHLKAHLYDISTAIDEIQSFFDQVPRRFDEYGKNLMLFWPRMAENRDYRLVSTTGVSSATADWMRAVCSLSHWASSWSGSGACNCSGAPVARR